MNLGPRQKPRDADLVALQAEVKVMETAKGMMMMNKSVHFVRIVIYLLEE